MWCRDSPQKQTYPSHRAAVPCFNAQRNLFRNFHMYTLNTISQLSWGHFTNALWAKKFKLSKSVFCCNLGSNDHTRSKFCTCLHSSAVVVWAKLWTDSVLYFYKRAACNFTSFGFWALQLFVKWTPGQVVLNATTQPMVKSIFPDNRDTMGCITKGSYLFRMSALKWHV